jgi:DNA-binding transcriptional MerR regulator
MDMSIGQLAQLTGLPVKTIRYYSEIGLVPEAGRTAAGYRRYDDTALARLELVRTLRDLGFDLATIGRVAAFHNCIEEVASAHADAIDPPVDAEAGGASGDRPRRLPTRGGTPHDRIRQRVGR